RLCHDRRLDALPRALLSALRQGHDDAAALGSRLTAPRLRHALGIYLLCAVSPPVVWEHARRDAVAYSPYSALPVEVGWVDRLRLVLYPPLHSPPQRGREEGSARDFGGVCIGY